MANQGEDFKYLTLDDWTRQWTEQETQWHRKDISPWLLKYIRLLDGGKKDLKIFVPLCGQTVDMIWLLDVGHRVVGVDGCQKALEDFFREHSMEYTVEAKNGILVLTEKSGRITLYCCNIFDFQKTGLEGSFDAVWDRASFEAINPEERPRYVNLVTALKAPNASHLLELSEYDDRLYKGHPFSLTMSKVLEYWGGRCDIELLDTNDAPERLRHLDLDIALTRNVFLLTLK